MGVAFAATQTEVAQIGTKFSLTQFGPTNESHSQLIGFDGSCSMLGSAFAGALLIDSIDAHDGHRLTKGHAGASVIPALLAMSSNLSKKGIVISGKMFLERLIVGYEVALRTGIELHRSSKEYHTSGAWCSTGVAAMGAKLFELNEDQFNHALGIADFYGPRSPMMRCIDYPSMVKDGAGWGSMTGVSAIFLAKEGFSGAPALPITESQSKPYFEHYEMLDQYFKPWPICRWAQPAVEAVSILAKQYNINAVDIQKIKINTFHQGVRLGNKRPKSSEEAQYSIGFPVAVMLARGKIGAKELSDSALNDPLISRVQKTVELVENQTYTDAFPAKRCASVTITLKDDKELSIDNVEARGDAINPLSDDEIINKFTTFTQSVISENNQKALIDLFATLETCENINTLLNLIMGKPK
jgi:2-methylcitrate dehydratase PrpD